MSGRDAHDRLAPAFVVGINGSPLPNNAMADIIAVTVLEDVEAASTVSLTIAAWDTVQVPAHWTTTKLAHFPGVVWFRHAFDLPAHVAGRAATLYLGPISDAEVSYVTGVRVGALSDVPGERRA